MRQRLRDLDARRIWDLALIAAFVPGAASWAFIVLIYPIGLGSHANIYTDAASAWLNGGDPWLVGPPTAVFAGPPPMLLPFVPFIPFPVDVTRVAWFALDLVLAVWVLRRLRMPVYWLAFPPLFSVIVLGHVEVLVLALLVLGGPASGLAAVVKPYAALPLIAERRWRALAVAAAVLVITFPVLPWPRFFADTSIIAGTILRQNVGDPIFGQPLPMLIAALALLSLGPRRAIWLAAPVLWPYAQPIYKTMTIPVMAPVLAFFWALPFAGSTLVGLVALAVLVQVDRVRALPAWVKAGIEPAAITPERRPSPRAVSTSTMPAAA